LLTFLSFLGDGFENTAMHYAVLEGHKAIVKTLLRYGADVNIQNKTGNTPLHVAYAYKRDQIMDYLLEKGASTVMKNNANQDPYDVEGNKLPEFAQDIQVESKKEKTWEIEKAPKKEKAKIVKKGDDKDGKSKKKAEEEEAAKKKAAADAEDDVAIKKQEEKDDLHFRIAMQRKQEADDKVNHWVKQATMADPEVRATIDRKVNEFTIKVMTRFFLASGAFAFLAMGVSTVGLLYSNQDLVITKPVRSLSSLEWSAFEFLDYGSFYGFATHCCCKERNIENNKTLSHVSRSDRIELWVCDNGFRKERLRETTRLNDVTGLQQFYNGSKLRGFCERTYPTGYCQPIYDPDKGRLKVRVCNSSFVTTKFTDLQEFDILSTYLW